MFVNIRNPFIKTNLTKRYNLSGRIIIEQHLLLLSQGYPIKRPRTITTRQTPPIFPNRGDKTFKLTFKISSRFYQEIKTN